MSIFDDRLKEKIEILDGSRPGPRDDAAVRMIDFKALRDELEQFQSKELTAAPTKDDFNKLVRDVKSISQALNAVALALGKRNIR